MNASRSSTTITTFSAIVLALGGVALLFGSDALLPRLLPGLPAGAAVLGQLISAGWLAVAWLNWNQRQVIIGGIYGRPMVLANFGLYMISAFSLGHPVLHGGGLPVMRGLCALVTLMAVLYGMLLLRGPFGDSAVARG